MSSKTVTIDGVEYDFDSLTEKQRHQFAALTVLESRIQADEQRILAMREGHEAILEKLCASLKGETKRGLLDRIRG